MARCPGNERHWFTYMVGLRSPFCARGCGEPAPRPLTDDEWVEYDDFMRRNGQTPRTREEYAAATVKPERERAAGAKELQYTGIRRKGRVSGTGHAGYGKKGKR